MSYDRDEIQEMDSTGYSFKTDWNIANFQSNQPEYNSKILLGDCFLVRLTLHNNISNPNDLLSMTFTILEIRGNQSLKYTLIIHNKDSKKSIRYNDVNLITTGEKETNVSLQIKSNDITSENGYLQNGTLQITLFISSEACIQNIAEYAKDWYINESICDFHSTLDPLELQIDEKTVSIALSFEKNESETYTLSIYLIDPEISFDGELEVKLNNYKSPSKSFIKSKNVKFNPNEFDIDPFTFELNESIFSDPNSGWVIYDPESHDVLNGLHFTVTFKKLQRDSDITFQRLESLKVENVKYMYSDFGPNEIVTIKPNDYNYYMIDMKYSKDSDFTSPIKSNVYHICSVIVQFTLDFSQHKLFMKLIDTYDQSDELFFNVIIANRDPKLKYSQSCDFKYRGDVKEYELDLPLSLDDLLDQSKGWLIDGFFGIKVQFDGTYFPREYINDYKYPLKMYFYGPDVFDGWTIYVPISLFSGDSGSDTIALNCVNVKLSRILLEFKFTSNPFVLKPHLSITNNDGSSLYLLLIIENNDPSKSLSYKYDDVSFLDAELPQICPLRSLKDDGFVFESESKSENLKVTFKYYYLKKKQLNNSIGVLDLLLAQNAVDLKQNSNEQDTLYYNISNYINTVENIPDDNGAASTVNELVNKDGAVKDEHKSEYNKIVDILKEPDEFKELNLNNVNQNRDLHVLNYETGYVGLKNQGATCYLNSLIQSLFHLPAFRKLVYAIPTSITNEDDIKSIPLNLQHLFYQMQFSNKPCDTSNLTKSFGWGRREIFQQHDIEEFSRILIDNLENKMKGTDLEGSIPKLLRGRYRNYIKCKNVDYQTVKEESFYDLSMDVYGLKNLYESFVYYVRQEELVGENQYQTPSYGKQDAIMGTEFIEFPPILYIQLRRFLFDQKQNKMIKINDRFEFPETINLADFLAPDSPSRSKQNIYDLFGVLVHDGLGYHGHYYAFLRTSNSPQWYKFNDLYVTKETVKSAVFDNYGDESPYDVDPVRGRSMHSGYMLVYINRANIDSIFEPIKEESIPNHLKFLGEKIEVQFIHESILVTNSINRINGFFPPKLINEFNNKKYPSFSFVNLIDKQMKLADLYKFVIDKFKSNKIRLWSFNKKKECPDKVIPNSDGIDIPHFFKETENGIEIFIQKVDDENIEKVDVSKAGVTIYIKFFFTEELIKKLECNENSSRLLDDPLQFLFSVSVDENQTAGSLVDLVNKKMGFPLDSKLDLYVIDQLNGSLKNVQLDENFSKVASGSIFIFQMNSESVDQIAQNSIKIEFPFDFGYSSLFKFDENSERIHDSLKSVENFVRSDYGRCSSKFAEIKAKLGKEGNSMANNGVKIYN